MDSIESAIETVNLKKSYKAKTVVNGVNLTVESGEVFALLGENGAGKTTTIKMLSCLLLPTDGNARIMGHSIIDQVDQIKPLINVSPQETAIAPNLTAEENLELIAEIYGSDKKAAKKKAKEMLAKFNLSGRANDKAKTFSGGMQRRLSIAMALITDPELIFLDEPTLGLDPEARQELWQQIAELKGKKTIVLTTHYLEEADALADHIGILKDGKLIAYGTPEELKSNLSSLKTIIVKCDRIDQEITGKLKAQYPKTEAVEAGFEIKGAEIDYNKILNCFNESGIKVLDITTKVSSLEDVYFAFNDNKEEAAK